MRIFAIGVDIGQRVDHAAVCLAEILDSKAVVRALVKYPLGTPYPLLVETVVGMVNDVKRFGEISSFTVDATGVGSVPASMFQEALPDIRVDFFIFTNKSKRELIGKVKVMHAFGRLRFATRKGDEVYNRTLTELLEEMKQLQAKVLREETGHPEVEVFKTGRHDDLFTALALALKDVSFPQGGPDVGFVKDDSWVKTPLDSSANEPNIMFF